MKIVSLIILPALVCFDALIQVHIAAEIANEYTYVVVGGNLSKKRRRKKNVNLRVHQVRIQVDCLPYTFKEKLNIYQIIRVIGLTGSVIMVGLWEKMLSSYKSVTPKTNQ